MRIGHYTRYCKTGNFRVQENFTIFAKIGGFAKFSCRENVVLYSSFQPVFRFLKSDNNWGRYLGAKLTMSTSKGRLLWDRHWDDCIALIDSRFVFDTLGKQFTPTVRCSLECLHTFVTCKCKPKPSPVVYCTPRKNCHGTALFWAIFPLIIVRF